MSNQIASVSSQSVSAARPAPARGGFGQQTRPRRKMGAPKGPSMSPEARRALEMRNQALIDEALAQGRVTQYPARWADGAEQGSGFGNVPD